MSMLATGRLVRTRAVPRFGRQCRMMYRGTFGKEANVFSANWGANIRSLENSILLGFKPSRSRTYGAAYAALAVAYAAICRLTADESFSRERVQNPFGIGSVGKTLGGPNGWLPATDKNMPPADITITAEESQDYTFLHALVSNTVPIAGNIVHNVLYYSGHVIGLGLAGYYFFSTFHLAKGLVHSVAGFLLFDRLTSGIWLWDSEHWKDQNFFKATPTLPLKLFCTEAHAVDIRADNGRMQDCHKALINQKRHQVYIGQDGEPRIGYLGRIMNRDMRAGNVSTMEQRRARNPKSRFTPSNEPTSYPTRAQAKEGIRTELVFDPYDEYRKIGTKIEY